MKKVVILLFMVIILGRSYSQIDNVFWFAAPDITAGHQHNPITLCVASFGNPATVTISQPANASFAPVIINLNPYSYYSLDLTAMESMIETQPENTVCNTGIKIVATEKISAYYQLGANNSEIYTLKGENALGVDFIVPMQNLLNTGNFTPLAYSSIEIVATEPNTVVTIIPSQPLLGGAPANVPITVVLNVGQSYAIKAASQVASAHLGNTRVTSNKPIAVNSSDDSAASNSIPNYSGQDLVGEQLVPVPLAGETFIAIWNNRAFESVFVFPTQNATNVYLNGSATPAATINVGQQYMHMLNTPATLITSDKPVFVFQLTGTEGEAGGTVLPDLACTGSQEIIYARPNYSTNMKVSIVVQTSYINGFTLNGSTTNLSAADFITLPYDPAWSYCVKELTSVIPVSTVMRISNSLGSFHVGILDYYSGMSSSLGYFSGYNNSGKIRLSMKADYCLHNSIPFHYISDGVDSIQLITPSGDTLTNPPFVINQAELQDTGRYFLIAKDMIGCDGIWLSDSIDLSIMNSYKPDLGEDRYVCEGEMFYLDSQYDVPNTSYYWNTGSTGSGIYIVTGGEYILNVNSIDEEDNLSCSGADTINVYIYPNPVVDFSADKTEGCVPQKITFSNLTLPDSIAFNFNWNIYNLDGNLILSSSLEEPVFDFNESGTFHVELIAISDDGCSDSVIKWNYITLYPQPVAEFSADPEIAFLAENGGTVNFSSYLSGDVLGNSQTTFLWDFGDGTVDSTDYNPVHIYETWGDYIVTFHIETVGSCADEISHYVTVEANLRFPNVITPNGDHYNDVFAIENLNPNINPDDPDKYRTNLLSIYDRWGKKVYEAHNYDTYLKDNELHVGDRYFDGEKLPDGVYYYTFYYKGKIKTVEYNGTISIIR